MRRWLTAAAGVLAVWSGLAPAADFDGDGTNDIGVFRPAAGLWAVRGITRAYYGTSGDSPMPGDYNGDGTVDIALFRPGTGLWAVKGVTRAYFGTASDSPLAGIPGGGGGGFWSKNGDVVYYNGGRVGIGTQYPYLADLLTVDGGSGYFANSVYHGVVIGYSGQSGLSILGPGLHGIQITSCGRNFIQAGEEDGETTFAVQSTGNVGIGSDPSGSYKLQVMSDSLDAGAFVSSRAGGSGVTGICNGGWGVYGQSSSGYAGYFVGDVFVGGTLTKNSGTFLIDHPLDPENRYLRHSFAESPEMINIYSGNAVLDENGEADVELPGYFEALNREFRYQLTPLGAPGPDLYISRKISGNGFGIAGGSPGMEVSWQVTGVRRDPYALLNPIVVEEDKAEAERGYYLNPEAYGQPESKSLSLARAKRKGTTAE